MEQSQQKNIASAMWHFIKDKYVLLAAGGLCVLCFLFSLLAVTQFPLNPDAGYYLSAARFITEGLVPYKDFFSGYSPGVYYIFTLLEPLNTNLGEGQRAFTYFLHLANAFLFYLILRTFRFDSKQSLLGGMLLFIGFFSLDGQSIILEPFQNIFILLSLLVAVRYANLQGMLVTGIFFGCALMMKQTSMFAFPVLAFLIALPNLFNAEKFNLIASIKRSAVFSVGASIPFSLFCLFTGQNLFTTFFKLITFGGRAKTYVAQEYGLYDAINVLFKADYGEKLLIPMSIACLLLLINSNKNIHRLFVFGFAINMLTIIFVRGYPHYMQLVIPWGILVLISLLDFVKSSEVKIQSIVAMLMLVPFVSASLITMHNLRIQFSKQPVQEQRQVSEEITAVLPNKQDTLIVGYPWLYYTASITPPDNMLSFTQYSDNIADRLPTAKQVVVMPTSYREFVKAQSITNEMDQFALIKTIDFEQELIRVYRRKEARE